MNYGKKLKSSWLGIFKFLLIYIKRFNTRQSLLSSLSPSLAKSSVSVILRSLLFLSFPCLWVGISFLQLHYYHIVMPLIHNSSQISFVPQNI